MATEKNSFSTYLENVASFSLLSKEKEVTLATAIRDAETKLVQLLLENENSRTFIAESANQFTLGKLRGSQIFENLNNTEDFVDEDDDNPDNRSHTKRQAEVLSDCCKHYSTNPEKVLAEVLSIRLSTDLLGRASEIANDDTITKEIGRVTALKHKMITHNLRLVLRVAQQHSKSGVPTEDLVQEGNIGLMNAVNKFDYQKGFKFSTYAYWWIRQAIQRSIANKGKFIKVPVYLYEAINKINSFLANKSSEEISNITHEDIEKGTGIPVRTVEKAMASLFTIDSLDTPIDKDGDSTTTLGETIPDLTLPDIVGMLEKSEARAMLETCINQLKSVRNQKILRLRFGLITPEMQAEFDQNGSPVPDSTLEASGVYYGISRERVRQIEKRFKSSAKFKNILKKFVEFDEEN